MSADLMPCNRVGERVVFVRCGETHAATIEGWDYVSGPRGTVCGALLSDLRYAARADNGMRVAVCESEVVS